MSTHTPETNPNKKKWVRPTAAIASTLAVLGLGGKMFLGGGDGEQNAPSPSPTNIESSPTSSPEITNPDVYFDLAKDVDITQFEIPAKDYTATELAQIIIDRNDAVREVFNNKEDASTYAEWVDYSLSHGNNSPTLESFTTMEMTSLYNLVKPAFYAKDADPNDENINYIVVHSGAISFANYISSFDGSKGAVFDISNNLVSASMETQTGGRIVINFQNEEFNNALEIQGNHIGDGVGDYALWDETWTLVEEDGLLKAVSANINLVHQ